MVLPNSMNKWVIRVVTLVLFIFSGTAANAGGDSGGKFKPGETIIHHVLDAHEIHIAGDLHIPLPIILLDDGLQVFMSSAFHHDMRTQVVDGDSIQYGVHGNYAIFHEKIYKLDEHGELHFVDGHPHNLRPMDFSITKNVTYMLVGCILMFLIFGATRKHYKRHGIAAPKKGISRWMEPLILFVRDDIAKASIGHGYERYVPFLLHLFFFIWFGNMLGLIPFLGGPNFTGNISVTLTLAVFTFLITTFVGNKHYWKHIFAPDVPVALLPLIIPIEIIGFISKPVVLMLRLFANITAGHIIILSFTCLIFIFGEMSTGLGYGVSVVSVLFSVFMNFLELLVAFLQAYVFVLLSALYFGSATEEAHH